MFVATRLNEMVTPLVLTKIDAFFVRQATRSHKPTGLHDSEEPSKSDVYALKRYRTIHKTTARIALQNELCWCSCPISSVTWAYGGTAGRGLEGACHIQTVQDIGRPASFLRDKGALVVLIHLLVSPTFITSIQIEPA